MKRDMDLIRNLLFFIEDGENRDVAFYTIRNEFTKELNEEVIELHIDILKDKNLITISDEHHLGEVYRLTSEGFDFIETIRDDKIWLKAKNIVKKETAGLSFEMLKITLATLVKEIIKS